MPLLNNKCGNCHTPILGAEKSLGKYGSLIRRYAVKRRRETRERTVDKGALLLHKKEERIIAACPVCGRTEGLDWVSKVEDKEWKDDKCS